MALKKPVAKAAPEQPAAKLFDDKPKTSKVTSLYLPTDLLAELEDKAWENRLSKSEVIRQILAKHLSDWKPIT
jgi:hypothetical protein